jgi:hypothetical protein
MTTTPTRRCGGITVRCVSKFALTPGMTRELAMDRAKTALVAHLVREGLERRQAATLVVKAGAGRWIVDNSLDDDDGDPVVTHIYRLEVLVLDKRLHDRRCHVCAGAA